MDVDPDVDIPTQDTISSLADLPGPSLENDTAIQVDQQGDLYGDYTDYPIQVFGIDNEDTGNENHDNNISSSYEANETDNFEEEILDTEEESILEPIHTHPITQSMQSDEEDTESHITNTAFHI
ncbi:hypothetical protein BDQ17DRAFT_1440927 [Cyathus striatus]|nr:hypothetical protein BDQ17DRAFT_1440927 [Cyathus striatus]